MSNSIKHKGWKWSIADVSNPALVAVLDNTSKALHITDASDQNTDWNVAADSHPSVYTHSATTPATDYIKMYHDATNGYLDVVGGNLMLAIAGTNEVTLTSSAMSPATTDSNALGTTALMWSDLFLASGAVINFDNGDITITHASNAVTLAGGAVHVAENVYDKVTQTALTDTAAVTAAQLLTRVLDGTPTGAATYTLPTAALLVAAINGAAVGDCFRFWINNKSGGANTITVAAGAGGTADGTLTVAQNVIRPFLVLITNVTAASEAYFVYGEG